MLAESPKDQETAIAEKKDTCRAHYAFSAIGEHLFRRWGDSVTLIMSALENVETIGTFLEQCYDSSVI